MNQSNKTLNNKITKLVNQPYKYGFSTTIEKDIIEKGLNENLIYQKYRPYYYIQRIRR